MPRITWRDAALNAIYRITNDAHLFDRTVLIEGELSRIVNETQSSGATPEQTLSRVLQELRDEGVIEFRGGGNYCLVPSRLIETTDVNVEQLSLEDADIDQAIRKNRLLIGVVETESVTSTIRRRRGQARLRQLTLENYEHSCALCDVADQRLLIASHILEWAKEPLARGRLDNVICLCRFHDSLFETGYWSLTDNLQVLRQLTTNSSTIRFLLNDDIRFRLPQTNSPAPTYLQHHRTQHRFGDK